MRLINDAARRCHQVASRSRDSIDFESMNVGPAACTRSLDSEVYILFSTNCNDDFLMRSTLIEKSFSTYQAPYISVK